VRAASTFLVGLAIPLAACGGSDTDVETGADTASSPGAAIAAAAVATLGARTAKVTLVVEHTRSEATWGIEAGEQQGSLTGVVDFDEYLVELQADNKRTIFDGTTVYFKDEYEQDKRWRKHDLDDQPTETSLLLARRYDPVHLLRLVASLDDFGPTARAVGEEEIRGAATTRYDAAVENEALAEALTPGISYAEIVESEAYPRPIDQYTPLDGWVGEDGRLHKVVYEWDAFGTLFGERMIIEFYDFGADVEIDVPSPEQTVRG
jgi:hypothetical protein